MATSYYNISLNHLANHLIYLSTASSFWLSLKSSYDHEFHLSKRLGMSPQDYEYLLVALDLAYIHKRWGFFIKMMKCFIEGHHFMTINCAGTFEVDTKKVNLNAFIQGESPKHMENMYFIWIGILYDNSPRKIEMQKDGDGRMIITFPRSNGLQIKQQAFRHCVEQLKWIYLLKKEDECGKDDNDENNVDVDDKDNDDKENDGDDEINASSTTIINKKRKCNTTTQGDDGDMAMSNMAKSYPHLLQALGVGEDGFDPINPSVQKSMHSLLSELNDLLSTAYQLDVSGLSNKRILYVQVPRTKSDCSLRNSKEWIDTTIQISGSKHGGTFESAYRITIHIIRYYHDSFLAACKTQQVCANQ
jgi:hypothetical protein